MNLNKEERLRNKEIMKENAKNAHKAVWIGIILLLVLFSALILLVPKVIEKSHGSSSQKKSFFSFSKPSQHTQHSRAPKNPRGCSEEFDFHIRKGKVEKILENEKN